MGGVLHLCRDTVSVFYSPSQISWEGDKGVHTFLKIISSKVNIITHLEFKLNIYDVTVQYINHYTTGIPSHYLLLS